MCIPRIVKRVNHFLFILLTVFIIGCNGDTETEATAQAVVEQLVSTNTPTPSPTNTPSPTETPVPPTETPIPPTETPIPPTETPFPPTPTSTPIIYLSHVDDEGDTFICDTQEAAVDSEVDMTAVQASRQADQLLMQVFLQSPLESDYSFAVLLVHWTSQMDSSAYLWEVHETNYRIGELDLQTGVLIAEPGDNLTIEHHIEMGEVQFMVPITNSTNITNSTSITNSHQIFVSSFHTPMADAVKNCDAVGPVTFTVDNP